MRCFLAALAAVLLLVIMPSQAIARPAPAQPAFVLFGSAELPVVVRHTARSRPQARRRLHRAHRAGRIHRRSVRVPRRGAHGSRVVSRGGAPPASYGMIARVPLSFGALPRPVRYIGGRLVCAINVNAALAERGIRGTGSALAKSFLNWGRPSAPVPGAIAVYNRRGGGHVAIVSRVEGGRVYVWNPSTRSRTWREVIYPRGAIAYRVAS